MRALYGAMKYAAFAFDNGTVILAVRLQLLPHETRAAQTAA